MLDTSTSSENVSPTVTVVLEGSTWIVSALADEPAMQRVRSSSCSLLVVMWSRSISTRCASRYSPGNKHEVYDVNDTITVDVRPSIIALLTLPLSKGGLHNR